MGILHDILFVIKVGNWRYTTRHDYDEAERIVKQLEGSVSNIRIEAERRGRE